jgi:hypothetical protein
MSPSSSSRSRSRPRSAISSAMRLIRSRSLRSVVDVVSVSGGAGRAASFFVSLTIGGRVHLSFQKRWTALDPGCPLRHSDPRSSRALVVRRGSDKRGTKKTPRLRAAPIWGRSFLLRPCADVSARGEPSGLRFSSNGRVPPGPVLVCFACPEALGVCGPSWWVPFRTLLLSMGWA